LLRLLLESGEGIMDRGRALTEVWGEESYFTARTMDVYIAKLRKHLKADPNLEIINVHGKGFKLLKN
jgi:two-component system OmpR family response regulator